MKSIIYLMWILVCFISLFSCSHEHDMLEDYIIEVEHFPSDTIVPKDTTTQNDTIQPKDSTNHDVSKKDTLICSYSKYMNISVSYGVGQGGACYDKYFFQGYSNNASLGVFDLEKKSSLGEIKIPAPAPSSKIHCNTLNFGTQKYDKNDFFPLLYVSSGYPRNVNGNSLSFIYVYRITMNKNTKGEEEFGITLVQTISLKGFGYWTEGILDNDHNILWLKYEPGGEYKYASFNVPEHKDGDVEVSLEDHITDFSIGKQPFTSSNQGHLYYKDKILLVSGTSPSTQKLAFIVIDLEKKARDLVIDLVDIGLRSEPENLFFYRDQLMIGYRNSIYKFNVRNIHDK